MTLRWRPVSLFCSRGGDRALLFPGLVVTVSVFAPGANILHKAATACDVVSRGPWMQDRFAYKTSCSYDIQAPYWAEVASDVCR